METSNSAAQSMAYIGDPTTVITRISHDGAKVNGGSDDGHACNAHIKVQIRLNKEIKDAIYKTVQDKIMDVSN